MESLSVDVHLDRQPRASAAHTDILLGLTGHPKSLSPKYFYDAAGSALFERITQLPEYYLTRIEGGLLRSIAADIMTYVCPREVVELGSGSATKIRSLLNTAAADELARYVPFDFDGEAVQSAAETIGESYPLLDVCGVGGDFERHLDRLPSPIGRRLIVFFGSTIGNLDPAPRYEFLVQVRRQLGLGDRLLLGLDLVKETAVLEAAYNDADGVTAEFNRNILKVVNREVGGDFQPELFRHLALYNAPAERIEMHLAPTSPQTVTLRDLSLTLRLLPEETIWTESSYTFTRESARTMIETAGLCIERWYSDTQDRFALVLVRPA